MFEEFRRGTARDLGAEPADVEDVRGEFTIVVAPPVGSSEAATETDGATDEQLDRLVRALLEHGVTPKTLARALGELPGVSHKQAYTRVLAIAKRG